MTNEHSPDENRERIPEEIATGIADAEQPPDTAKDLTPEEINNKLQILADALEQQKKGTEEDINQRKKDTLKDIDQQKLRKLQAQLTESDLDSLSPEEWKILFEQEDQESGQ